MNIKRSQGFKKNRSNKLYRGYILSEDEIGLKIDDCCETCLIWRKSKVISKSIRLCRKIRQPVLNVHTCNFYEENETTKSKKKGGLQTGLTRKEYGETI